MSKEKTKKLSISIKQESYKILCRKSSLEGRTISNFINWMIEAYLSKEFLEKNK